MSSICLTNCLKFVKCHVLQAAYQAGEDEICLSAMGRSYTVDFNSMQQINEDTGTARPVQRKLNPLAGSSQQAAGTCTVLGQGWVVTGDMSVPAQ